MAKIILTGPHYCGKTTVLRKLKDYFLDNPEVGFIESDGSRCPISYKDVDYLRANPKTEINITYWMIADNIKREIEAKNKYKNLVFDRCVIDQLAYPAEITGKDNLPKSINLFIREWLIFEPYDKIFIFPANPDFLKAGTNNTGDVNFQKNIEQRYLELTKEFNLSSEILPLDQDRQIDLILNYLKSNL